MATAKKTLPARGDADQQVEAGNGPSKKTKGSSPIAKAKVPQDRLLQLRSIEFLRPPFGKLGGICLEIAPRITLIAGRNGVGKSTVLALIGGTSGITRGKSARTYLGSLPRVNAEEILRLSFERDFVKDEARKPQVLLTYRYAGEDFQKKLNVSGNEKRLRVVPRNDPKGERAVHGLSIPADGKVPLPTIYLGMMRVLPTGESAPEALQRKQVAMALDDLRVYKQFTDQVISTGVAHQDAEVTAQAISGTRKNALYPKYDGYDSTSVSLGQDSLSSIASALASFSLIKRQMGDEYRGGLLVIDELDAGFHPRAQIDLFNELKGKARELQIQIVATTHSLTLLRHAHAGIYGEHAPNPPLDQIVYLQGGVPLELLDASEFAAIEADMHLELWSAPLPKLRTVKVYVEDDEAVAFLKAILTKAKLREYQTKHQLRVQIISAHVGCSNLIHLLRADEYFETVVIVPDADSTGVNVAPNVAKLPSDPRNQRKQAPEVILKSMCEMLLTDANSYPEVRKRIKKKGGTTDYVQKHFLQPQAGEDADILNLVDTNRESAKSWFTRRLDDILTLELIEGWVSDNGAEVTEFLERFEAAMLAASRLDIAPVTPAAKKASRRAPAAKKGTP